MMQNFIRIDDEDESLMKLKKAIEETRVVLDAIATNAFGQIQIELTDDEIFGRTKNIRRRVLWLQQ